MTAAEKFVTRRYPEADVYPITTAAGVEVFQVWDDADQNPGMVKVLGQGATEAEAWKVAAAALGSKRAA